MGCFGVFGVFLAQLRYLHENPDFEFDTIELDAAAPGADVVEFGDAAHEFEVEGRVSVQVVGKQAGVEFAEDLVDGGGQVGLGRGFAELMLELFFEPAFVGAQAPAGDVVDGDTRVTAFGEGSGDFGVGAPVEEEIVDEVADDGGEAGDFAGGAAGELRRPSFAPREGASTFTRLTVDRTAGR